MSLKHNQAVSHFYVDAASVAAALSDVRTQAESISLEAMNAKVLVARAGTKALGFRPITDFMVQLADITIELVKLIDREALRVSRQSVAKIRSEDSVARFEKAQNMSKGNRFADSIAPTINTLHQQDKNMDRVLLNHTRNLLSLLEEIAHHMTAASVMASTARVEAAAIDSRFRHSFQSVSEKLASAAESIKKNVLQNKRRLQLSAGIKDTM